MKIREAAVLESKKPENRYTKTCEDLDTVAPDTFTSVQTSMLSPLRRALRRLHSSLLVRGVPVNHQLDQVAIGVTHVQTGRRTLRARARRRLVEHRNSSLLEEVLRLLHGSFPTQTKVRRSRCVARGEGRALDLVPIDHVKVQLPRVADATSASASTRDGNARINSAGRRLSDSSSID